METSVYRKPTFTGQYLRWKSFSPLKRKISLISTLVPRVLMICTKRRLNEEIERIKKILLDNGYPKNIINAQITKKIAQFSTLKRFGPEKCPVYLRVPWIGKPSTNLEKEVKTAVESCYGSVSTRLVFTSKRMLPVARKDVLPAIQKSFVIYESSATVIVGTYCRANISTTTGSHQATCFAMVKTAIDSSTPISTTQIVQTNRHQTGL